LPALRAHLFNQDRTGTFVPRQVARL
jgi:hypothetical protein